MLNEDRTECRKQGNGFLEIALQSGPHCDAFAQCSKVISRPSTFMERAYVWLLRPAATRKLRQLGAMLAPRTGASCLLTRQGTQRAKDSGPSIALAAGPRAAPNFSAGLIHGVEIDHSLNIVGNLCIDCVVNTIQLLPVVSIISS